MKTQYVKKEDGICFTIQGGRPCKGCKEITQAQYEEFKQETLKATNESLRNYIINRAQTKKVSYEALIKDGLSELSARAASGFVDAELNPPDIISEHSNF